jgi:hypothetical protein
MVILPTAIPEIFAVAVAPEPPPPEITTPTLA